MDGNGMTNPYQVIGAFRDDQNNKHVTQQNFAITQDSIRTKNGMSDSPFPIGDYTYPQWFNLTGFVSGNTGAQTAGTAHTHPISLAAQLGASYTHPVNTALGGYIRCTASYVVDTIALSTNMASTSAGGNIYFQIYYVNADGSLTQVWSSDIKSAVPVATAGALVAFAVTSPFPVYEGEEYLVRIANLTSPSVNLNTLSLQWATPSSPNSQHKTTTLTLATQTSFSVTEANTALTAGTLLPWVAWGQYSTPIVEDLTWADDFNRINLGRRWLQNNTGKTGVMTIVKYGTNADGTPDGRLTYTGTTTGIQEALFLRPVSGDAMRADIDLHDLNTSGNVDVFVCRDRYNQSGVVLAVNATTAIIGSLVGGTQTTRATNTAGSNEATWSIYYEPTPDKYTVLKDGQDIGLTWTDSSHVVPHGPNCRYSSVMIECASSTPGGTCDNWVFRDWKP